jgi:hypothetical protein
MKPVDYIQFMEVFGVDAFQPALVGGKLLNWGYTF